jgi:hypothetical protein
MACLFFVFLKPNQTENENELEFEFGNEFGNENENKGGGVKKGFFSALSTRKYIFSQKTAF